MINFFKGHPTNDLLPNAEILQATQELLTPKCRPFDDDPEDRHPLSYGSDPGSQWVRQSIADHVNGFFRPEKATTFEDINLTGGASYGIMNILEQCTLPHTGVTKRAFIVSPTYYLINETFIDAGFKNKLSAITETEKGVDLSQLRTLLEQFDNELPDVTDTTCIGGNKKVYKFVMYLVPTYSNPSGCTYDLETRIGLIELAREFDMLIICDDVYDMLVYDDSPVLPRLVHMDRATARDSAEPIVSRVSATAAANNTGDGSASGATGGFGNTISNATFSKVVAPGLRVGHQETINRNLAYQLSQGGANCSGGSPSQLNSMIIGTMLKNGSADEVIASLTKVYKSRAATLKQCIEKYLPQGTKYDGTHGGYFSWCTLPTGYDSSLITKECLQRGVVLADGNHFEVDGDLMYWGRSSVRLSISWLREEEIEQGVKIWGEVCKEFAPEK